MSVDNNVDIIAIVDFPVGDPSSPLIYLFLDAALTQTVISIICFTLELAVLDVCNQSSL